MSKPQSMNRVDKMVKLWMHETCRVFHDRLINSEDTRYFTELVAGFAASHFRMSDWTHKDLFEDKIIIFADFMRRGISYEDRQYDEVKDIPTITQVINDYMEEYNVTHSD